MPRRRRTVLPALVLTCTGAILFSSVACSSSDTDEAAPAHSTSSGGASGSGGSGASGGHAGAAAGAAGACETLDAPAPIQCSERSTPFASVVVDHEFGPGQATGQDEVPRPWFGPPEGAGASQGARSGVVSLGNGGWVIFGFEDNAIVDAPGPDFIVFENAFHVGGNPDSVFAELATVAVSDDGEHWVEFPCTASEPPYGACAGWHPTLANAAENDLDPTDPREAGGDAFDLADICVSQARYVKITDRADLNGALDGVFDLDAVAIVNAACPTGTD